LGYVRAVDEMVSQGLRPDSIFISSSSGGTLAGVAAGVDLCGLPTKVVAISPDDPAADIAGTAGKLIEGMRDLLGCDSGFGRRELNVDDSFIGEGYGIPTEASREAISLAARTEALFLDPTYTAKAMAGMIHYIRSGKFRPEETVLFWHTGGQVELVAQDR
jgi:1-aminocyclopropane-1-carboxylate deaminase/D-cysteine desulfhydrase-like pyridoxal-dependent ACC family enzyme